MGPAQVFNIAKAVYTGFRLSGLPWKSPEFLREYQSKALRKAVSIAYDQTGFYKRKYDSHGIHPRDIKGVEDLPKLPIITKKELIENIEETVPRSLNKEEAIRMGTSGSTGQPILIYKDYIWMAHFIGFVVRMLKIHKMGLPRFAYIGDINSQDSMENKLKRYSTFFSFGRGVLIDVKEDMEQILSRLEKENINYIATYTTVMRELAILRKNGKGKHIKLRKVGLTGEILDNYTRELVESAFGCKCYSAYISTEGGAVALECEKKKMHINTEAVIIETVNPEGKPVAPGAEGNVLLTCCDGGLGTPIIRYSGCADIGQLLREKCSCGQNTPIMGPVKGRIADTIQLPDGRKYHSFSMTIPMEKIQRHHGEDLIRQYQIVQHELNKISISLVRNTDSGRSNGSLSAIMDSIEKTYGELFGSGVELAVMEVEALPRGSNPGMPTPLVVSRINGNQPGTDAIKAV